jgi:hypothetical protein
MLAVLRAACVGGTSHSIGIISRAVLAWYQLSAMTATPPLKMRSRIKAGSGIGNAIAEMTPGFRRCFETLAAQVFDGFIGNTVDVELAAILAPLSTALVEIAEAALRHRLMPLDAWKAISEAYDGATTRDTITDFVFEVVTGTREEAA